MNKRLTLEEAIRIVSKEEIEEYYKLHNRSQLFDKAKDDWHIGSKTFKELLKFYNITKSKEDTILTCRNTCLEKYGKLNSFNYEKFKSTLDNRSEEKTLAWK